MSTAKILVLALLMPNIVFGQDFLIELYTRSKKNEHPKSNCIVSIVIDSDTTRLLENESGKFITNGENIKKHALQTRCQIIIEDSKSVYSLMTNTTFLSCGALRLFMPMQRCRNNCEFTLYHCNLVTQGLFIHRGKLCKKRMFVSG